MTAAATTTTTTAPTNGTPRHTRVLRDYVAAVVVSVAMLGAVYVLFPKADNYLSLKHRMVKHLTAGVCLAAAGWGAAAAIRPARGTAERRGHAALVMLIALAGATLLGARLYHPALNAGDHEHVKVIAGHERLWERYRSLAEAADSRAIYVAALAVVFAGMIGVTRARGGVNGASRRAGPGDFIAACLCFAGLAAVLNVQVPQAPALAFAEEALELNSAIALLFAARAAGGSREPQGEAGQSRGDGLADSVPS
jgi:hypothetical protein